MAFKTCPNCGTAVDEGTLRCPACHADISATMRMPRQLGTWCAGCGALVPEGVDACPACGLPVGGDEPASDARPASVDADAIPAVEDDVLSAASTQVMPRIEPALPAEPTDQPAAHGADALPATRQLATFVVAAALMVVGVSLLITHPWNPDAYSIRATTEADTSKAGFPGRLDALTSQDRSSVGSAGEEAAPEGAEPLSADELTYRTLKDAWGELGAYREELAEEEALVRSAAAGDLAVADAEAGSAQAAATSVSLSNTIATIEQADVSSGTSAQDRERLVTLGNWLRNWSDKVSEAWDIEGEGAYGASSRARAALDAVANDEGVNAYLALFDASYAQWEPAEPEGGQALP